MSRKYGQILVMIGTLLLLMGLLLAQEKNVNKKERRVWTRLMEAARTLKTNEVKALLDSGVNPNQVTESGTTPLMYACQGRGTLGDIFWDYRQESAKVVRLLCDAGAKPNLQTNQGVTALMLMAQAGNELGVKNLLAAKANVHLQDKRGRTALTYSSRENGDCTRLLLEAGSKPLLIDLLLLEKRQDVLEFLKGRKTIHGVGIYDESALFLAAENDWADVAKLLIERGADVNAPSKNGVTPLMSAIGGYYSHGQVDGQRRWSKQGERPEPDPKMPERIELVKLLIKHGANVNAKIQDEFFEISLYPLTIARETLSDKIAEILKQAGAVEYDKKVSSKEKKSK